MALTDNGNGGLSAADVAAVIGSNNGGFGWGGDASWLIVLFLFAMMGGWGNGFGGGYGGGNSSFPWMLSNNTDNLVTNGFNQATTTSLLGDIQSSITNGFASSEVADCNRAMNSMQTAYTNQIASMNQRFADVTSLNNHLDTISSSLAQCCCDNKAAIADLKYTISTEACADRAAVDSALRDVLTANTASTQRILDQMCQDKIDAKNERIQELQTQLNMANLAASQNAQTSRLLQDNAAQTVALEQYLNPTPVPAYVVQNPNCCNNYGCGFGGFNGNV